MREYIIEFLVPDSYLEEGQTTVVDAYAIENGDLSLDELIQLVKNDDECSMTIQVRDVK